MEQNNLTIPIAIVVAGLFIAGGIFLSGGNSNKEAPTDTNKKTVEEEIILKPVDESDHISGNPNADILLVEYSDPECPFCKRFHTTMNKIMDEYGKDGKVAWVYRQFPIDSLHSKARKEIAATECANELGGNKAFWSYLNKIFEITPSNNDLDLTVLPKIAEDQGLDKTAFEECLASGKYDAHIEADYQEGVKAGVKGTPYTVVITKRDGKTYPISGAQPYNTVKTIIDGALKDLEK
jgi:protein-disulfide isomerase